MTGFVAATGKSYLCEDTANDPLYLTGVTGAKSSLTVPLKLHNEVIGTFNVESPQPHAFSDSDLAFLKVFCRDVAMSLNTLQLLVAQQMNAAQESVAEIHSQVALPIDEIVADATFIDEQAANLDEATRLRLKKILDSASSIRDVIQKVGRSLPPVDIYIPPSCDKRDKLKGKRVLVVDPEPAVLNSAHKLLEQHECHVQTAQQGADAEAIFKHSAHNRRYDVVIAGVKLPDMSAYDLMMRLKPLVDRIPLILTQEFGWDAGPHARQVPGGRAAPQRLRDQAVQGAATARHGRNDHRLDERGQGVELASGGREPPEAFRDSAPPFKMALVLHILLAWPPSSATSRWRCGSITACTRSPGRCDWSSSRSDAAGRRGRRAGGLDHPLAPVGPIRRPVVAVRSVDGLCLLLLGCGLARVAAVAFAEAPGAHAGGARRQRHRSDRRAGASRRRPNRTVRRPAFWPPFPETRLASCTFTARRCACRDLPAAARRPDHRASFRSAHDRQPDRAVLSARSWPHRTR